MRTIGTTHPSMKSVPVAGSSARFSGWHPEPVAAKLETSPAGLTLRTKSLPTSPTKRVPSAPTASPSGA